MVVEGGWIKDATVYGCCSRLSRHWTVKISYRRPQEVKRSDDDAEESKRRTMRDGGGFDSIYDAEEAHVDQEAVAV